MKALLKHLYLAIVVVPVFATAQEEVVLDVTGSRSMEPAFRIIESPKVMDTVFPVPNANFPLLAINYDPFFELNPIQPATINLQQKLPQLYKGYARVGVGSVFMPLAEVYYNNSRTRKLNYGFHAKHLGSYAKMRDVAPATFDRTNVKAFVGVNERKYNWGAEGYYANQGLHYYGFNNPKANADSISQRFNTFGGKGNFTYHRHDSLGVNWTAGFEYRHFNDKKPKVDSLSEWNARENYVGLSGGAWFKWGDEIFAADADLKINGYRYGKEFGFLSPLDSGLVANNVLFSLRPHVTTYSKNGRLKAKLGVNISADKVDKPRLALAPDMEVKYSFFDDILIPYAKLGGGMKQNTLYSLTRENEFVRSNLPFRNENVAISATIGLKGTLSKRVGFNVQGMFYNVKDKAIFVTDTTYSAGNKFAVIYDTMNVASVEGSLMYQLMEKTKIEVIGRYHSYMPVNNSYAWNLPQVEGIFRASYNLFDRFIFTADVTVETGRKALLYALGDGIQEENGQYWQKLGPVVDGNLSAEFRYNKRISGFINLNNVAAQRYKRWYNYPVQGFQAMVGVTARF